MSDFAQKLPISAIVVTYNEDHRLESCLTSLNFCNEIIVYDLGSKDNSPTIGKALATKFIAADRVEFVELLWPALFSLATNKFVLTFDPDQVFPAILVDEIARLLAFDPDLGYIGIPYLYYYKNKPLYYTIWGGIRYRPLLVNREVAECTKLIHNGLKFHPQAREYIIRNHDKNPIRHYWIDSFAQMLEKHWRYLRNEGRSRYESGERYSLRFMLNDMKNSVQENFVKKKCLRMGLLGVELGIFHFFYVWGCHVSLLIYQLKIWIYSRYSKFSAS